MKAWVTLAATLAFLISPFVTEGFAGFRPDQFPIPQDNAPVQPSGYAFAIWSVIYLWLLVSAVVGVWRHRNTPDWDTARLPLILSLAIGHGGAAIGYLACTYLALQGWYRLKKLAVASWNGLFHSDLRPEALALHELILSNLSQPQKTQ